MRQRTVATVLLTALLALTLVATSALTDLRSPAGTQRLAATLADDPAFQQVLADAIADALVADAVERSALAAPLIPLLRPLVTTAAAAALASPAGRAAVTAALADALEQLTRRGPIVIDLREAALAAAAEAPPPLDTLARVAIEQGRIGVVVVGGEEGSVPPPDAPRLDGRVAGLPSGVALALVALLLAAAVAAAALPRPGAADRRAGRRGRLVGSGLALGVVGAITRAGVRIAPEAVAEALVTSADVAGTPLAALLPTLADGLSTLLARTGTIGSVLATAGVALVVLGLLDVPRSPAATDRDAHG